MTQIGKSYVNDSIQVIINKYDDYTLITINHQLTNKSSLSLETSITILNSLNLNSQKITENFRNSTYSGDGCNYSYCYDNSTYKLIIYTESDYLYGEVYSFVLYENP